MKIGMVGVLSIAVTSACGTKSTTAWCVDRMAPPTGKTKGGYKVVPDAYCDTREIENGTVGYGRYFWYYGGRRDGSGYVRGGSYSAPNSHRIKSNSGHSLIRGGFGGHGRSGG